MLLISACLLGYAVRYDGGHKFSPRLAALRHVRWVPVCPEVLAGFGIPRPSLELRHTEGGSIVVRSGDGPDRTARLRGACLRLARDVLDQGVQGMVAKSRSPSCAAGGAEVFPALGGSPRLDGVGLFVQALRDLAPALPVTDEVAFEDAEQRAAFFRKIGARAP